LAQKLIDEGNGRMRIEMKTNTERSEGRRRGNLNGEEEEDGVDEED